MSAGKLSASMVFKSVSLTPSFSPSVYQSVTLTLSSKDFKEGCSDGRGHCGCLDAVWDSAVATSGDGRCGDGGCGDGRVGARGLRPEGSQYTQNSQCECTVREHCSIKCQQHEKCSSNELLNIRIHEKKIS